jgi:hypothetical protein
MNPRNVLLAALSASVLCACTTGGESLSVAPQNQRQIYYFSGFATVDADYINRYACLNPQVVPVCTCSPPGHTCDCRC